MAYIEADGKPQRASNNLLKVVLLPSPLSHAYHPTRRTPNPFALFGSNLLWAANLKVDKGKVGFKEETLTAAVPVTIAVVVLPVTAFSFLGLTTWEREGKVKREEGFSSLPLVHLFPSWSAQSTYFPNYLFINQRVT